MARRVQAPYNQEDGRGRGGPSAPGRRISIPNPTREDGPMNPEPRRLFVREAGWQVGHKADSMREFCYMTAPGQDFYHRLDAGELFLYRGDERLCIPCAERRGLLAHE